MRDIDRYSVRGTVGERVSEWERQSDRDRVSEREKERVAGRGRERERYG